MAQTAGRGTSWVSVVLGWLAALGAALILSSIVGAIVGALFAALGAKSGTTGGGISGVIGVLLTLLIAFYLGGYTAGRMASRSGVKHGLLVELLALVVTIVLALIGAAVGANFIDQLGGVTLPGPAGKAAQNIPQQGLTPSSRSLASLPSCSRSSEGHLGAHVGPESDKSAPTHPQEGTVKIWIEGRDTSSLGPIPIKRSPQKQARFCS